MTGGTQPMRKWAPAVALGFGIISTVCLVLPWVRLGTRNRSSIDLIGSAGALDIIEGLTKVLVVFVWFLLPVIVAVAMLSLAAGRTRMSALFLLPLGPMVGLVVVVLLRVIGDAVVWGAWMSAAFAVLASISAIMVLVDTRREATQ